MKSLCHYSICDLPLPACGPRSDGTARIRSHKSYPGVRTINRIFYSSAAQDKRKVKVPGGTPLEIEAVHTVRSVNVKPNEYVSFRVLVPIKIGDVTVIEKDALVTGRILEAKRGGRWGKAGKLSWTMTDVIAVDLSRVPVQMSGDLPDNPHPHPRYQSWW